MSNYYAVPSAENGLALTAGGVPGFWSAGPWQKIAEGSDAYSYVYGITFQELTAIVTTDLAIERLFQIATGSPGNEMIVIEASYIIRRDTTAGFYMQDCYRLFLPEPFTVAPFASVSIRAWANASPTRNITGVKLLYRAEKQMIPPSVFNINIENFKSVSAGSGISVSERTW